MTQRSNSQSPVSGNAPPSSPHRRISSASVSVSAGVSASPSVRSGSASSAFPSAGPDPDPRPASAAAVPPPGFSAFVSVNVPPQLNLNLNPDTARAETPPARTTRTMTTLLSLPRVREVQLRPSRTINWRRPVNHEAILAFTRGRLSASACVNCMSGAGPCVACVIVPGSLLGSCSNCHYSSEGARCSLRPASGPFAAVPLDTPSRSRHRHFSRASSDLSSAPFSRGSPSARSSSTLRRLAETHRVLADLYEERAKEEEEEK